MSEFNAIQHDRSAAIKVALGAFLDPQQTARAVGLWHEKYAAQPTFSVQYFVRECCALFGVESLRNQLVQSLVLELNSQRMKPVAEQAVRDKSSVDGPRAEAAVLTFQLLFRALTDSAGQLRGREISRYVADGLVKMPLAKDVQAVAGAVVESRNASGRSRCTDTGDGDTGESCLYRFCVNTAGR
ncbi:MAG: hypothetical protein IPK95_02920 [Cellvibrionales bacterium]|nr:hypothetical protein [Cellvibrionales bacterium]